MTSRERSADPLVRTIADTAHWAAFFRAQETERKDAVFRDPFAARLAGERGARMVESMGGNTWAWITRTWLYDDLIRRGVAEGADTVVNLAAGLDARPYRTSWPPSLRWIEVDLPEILDEKERALEGETPTCRLERVRLDLSDRGARRALIDSIGSRSSRVLIVTEGLLIYLAPDDVAALAEDLAIPPTFREWVIDLASPGLLRMIQGKFARHVHDRAPMQFGPAEGPLFFEPHGWTPVEVHSMLKTAVRLRRVGPVFRLLALLPESSGRQGRRPWGGVCRLQRKGQLAGTIL